MNTTPATANFLKHMQAQVAAASYRHPHQADPDPVRDEYMEHLAEQYYNFAQEAITMTTTPITQPVNAPRAVYEHGQQPRPPIPAEVQAQAKSAALIICEQIADIVAIQTAKINKIESEIGILQDMIRDMASSLKQLPPAPPAAQSQSADAHKCVKHGVEMMRHEKNGQTWYSHQDGEKWCRGK